MPQGFVDFQGTDFIIMRNTSTECTGLVWRELIEDVDFTAAFPRSLWYSVWLQDCAGCVSVKRYGMADWRTERMMFGMSAVKSILTYLLTI